MSTYKRKFSQPVIDNLKYYVYIYSNPLTKEIFYVGKGKGNRVFSHLQDNSESEKVRYIQDLRKQNLEPEIEILIHGLENEDTALRVESSIIDLLDIDNLTNKQSGFKSALYGRMTLDQISAAYDKRPVNIEDPVIMIRINKGFKYSLTSIELYDVTRSYWRVNPDVARKAKYAFAVYGGTVQEVYEIVEWYKACTTFTTRQGSNRINRKDGDKLDGRYEFIGNVAKTEIRNKYKYRSVEHYFRKGNSNPIKYCNLNV